jgi:ATP-binding cassette subfamily B protein
MRPRPRRGGPPSAAALAAGRPNARDLCASTPRARAQLFGIVSASLASGAAEALILILVVRLAWWIGSVPKDSSVELAVGISLKPGWAVVVGVGLIVCRLGIQSQVARLNARVSAVTLRFQREEVMKAYLRANWRLQAADGEGSLQELLSVHAARASDCVLFAGAGLAAVTGFTVLIIAAVLVNPLAAISSVVVAAVLMLSMRPLTDGGRRASEQQASANGEFSGRLAETVRLFEDISVTNTRSQATLRLKRIAAAASDAQYRTQLLGRLLPALYQNAVLLLVFAALAILSTTSSYSVPSIGAAVLLLIRATSYSQVTQSSYHQVSEYWPYLDALRLAADRYEGGADRQGTRSLVSIETLELRNASYVYEDGSAAVKDLSLQVRAGRSLGIIGQSGSGKSTLLRMLACLAAPSSGEVLLDGIPAHEISPESKARSIALVSQTPRLLSGTITENIAFFRDAITQSEVRTASDDADLAAVVRSLPDGFDTYVGPGSSSGLSGGQAQRLCLARAIAGRPGFLFMDEPTSALDRVAEDHIVQSLLRLKETTTLVVVTHRPALLALCDEVVEIVDGAISSPSPANKFGSRHPEERIP